MKKQNRIKRIIALLTVLVLIACTGTVAFADAGGAVGPEDTVSGGVLNLMIDYSVRLAFTLLMTLIGVLGTWLGTLAAKNQKMQNTAQAIKELTESVKTTVGSLQQTVVDKLKEAHEDHKLSEKEIYDLGVMLKEKAIEKLSQPTKEALEAAAVDVEMWITDTAENWINRLKSESGLFIGEVMEQAE